MPNFFQACCVLLAVFGEAIVAPADAHISVPICPAKPGWSDPARPAHIFGNTWYVGTCAISAILVTSKSGHVLIDGATDGAAAHIESNIRALGFRPEEVRYLLSSHEHFDHIGGLAHLQKVTGATVVAREPAATTLERGNSDRNDPQFGQLEAFTPLHDIQRIDDGATLGLGALKFIAHATPGHTAGSTSWTWDSCEGDDCRHMAYVDSLTAVSTDDYRFTKHPGLVETFRATFSKVAGLPCDILMTPHPSASHLLARIGPTAGEALIGPQACTHYAEGARKNLDARLAREESEGKT